MGMGRPKGRPTGAQTIRICISSLQCALIAASGRRELFLFCRTLHLLRGLAVYLCHRVLLLTRNLPYVAVDKLL